MFTDKPRDSGDTDHGVEREFTLDELLAQCDPSAPPPEQAGWENRFAIGGEIL
jgi:hypothetical protein